MKRTHPTYFGVKVHMVKRLPLLALLCALPACGDDVADDERVGTLDNGTFQYLCVDDSDPLCPTGRFANDFPDRIGTDGVFDLDYDPDDGSSANIDITPVATDIIELRSDRFRAVGRGVTSLIAERGSTTRVLDIVHLTVVDVAALQVDQAGRVPRLTLAPGSTQSYDVVAVDEDGRLLAGARDFTWTVSDPRVLRLDQPNPTAHMDVRAVAEGNATLTVESGGVTESVLVVVDRATTVDDAGVPPEAGPAPNGEAGVDAAPPPLTDGGDAGRGRADAAADTGAPTDAGPVGADARADAASDAGDAGDAAP